ncbi:type IV secretion system DNA-binding domain-containing protein [Acinetobacter colistiniresistens]|uniref:type IV secretion system DNA-binding domain-containing protein n=1 Tax=Acinetobacter colistiniresistens TaxID=280145 RepID=UPI002FE390F8
MKAKNNNGLIEFTRGSEIWIHQFKMFISSVMNVILFGICATLLIVGLFLYLKLDQTHLVAVNVQWDILVRHIFSNTDSKIPLKINGVMREYTIPEAQRLIDPYFNQFKTYVFKALLLGLFSSLLLVFGLIYYWFSYGKQVMADEQIRGSELKTNDELINKIRDNGGFSPYKLAGVPMKKNTEGTNIGVIGSPGSGKSQVFRDVISQVRTRKKKSIIYDPSGEFTQEFYRPGIDIILNPFDARMPFWSPYLEVEHEEHFDSIAKAFIPVVSKEPYFETAAQAVFSEIMRELFNQGDKTNKSIYDTISLSTVSEIHSLLQGTPAAKHVDPKNEKTVLGVLSTVQTKLAVFRYLPDSGEPFSIRQWVKNSDEDSCIFLSIREEQKTTIEPLIALWFSVFIKSVMNLPAIHKELLWLFCDEIPTLPRMDDIPMSLTNTRKYGLCHMLGFQDLPQLDSKYGDKIAQSMLSALQTKIFMRVNENNTAKRMSEILGQMEVAEKNQSRSMGIESSRDGDSFITQRRERFIVMPSEIMRLPDLKGYLRIPGDFPVTLVQQVYHPHTKNQPPVVLRESLSALDILNNHDDDQEIHHSSGGIFDQVVNQNSTFPENNYPNNHTQMASYPEPDFDDDYHEILRNPTHDHENIASQIDNHIEADNEELVENEVKDNSRLASFKKYESDETTTPVETSSPTKNESTTSTNGDLFSNYFGDNNN